MSNFFREPDRRQRFPVPVDLLLGVVKLMDLSVFERHDTKLFDICAYGTD